MRFAGACCRAETAAFSDLRAVLVDCSLVRDPRQSHTHRLLSRVVGVVAAGGVDVEVIHALEHRIELGTVKEATDHGAGRDDWPARFGRDGGVRE